MTLIKGPFTIRYGDVTIEDIEEIELDQEITSTDYESAKGVNFEIDRTYKASATLTLLATDIALLAAILPQHVVPYGDTTSTGEVVEDLGGMIDIVPRKCNPVTLYAPLDIISCSNQSQKTRIVNCRAKFAGMDISSKLQKIMVKFIGEAAPGQAVIQISRNAIPTPPTLFALDDGDLFALDNGDNLLL